MSLSLQTLMLPDYETGWLASKAPFKSQPTLVENLLHDQVKSPFVGLPAKWVRSVGLILPSASEDLIPSLVQAQLEKKGLLTDLALGSSPYVIHHLGQNSNHQLISVDLFQPNLPQEYLVPTAITYLPATRALELPQNELVFVVEHRLVVMLCTAFGKVWSSCVLGDIEYLNARDIRREITLAQLSLESKDGFGSLRGITFVGPSLNALASELQHSLELPVHSVPKLSLQPASHLAQLPHYLPPSVRQDQHLKKRRKQYLFAGLIAMGLYALLFTSAYLYLQNLEKKTVQLEDELSDTAVPASLVKEATQRWRALEPAINSQRYPLIQLSQINTILPPSGVLIKKFVAKPDEIEINGDSRDAQTATQLLEDLKKHPKLSRFDWNMPVPSVRNNIATFKIQGKLQGS